MVAHPIPGILGWTKLPPVAPRGVVYEKTHTLEVGTEWLEDIRDL